jgi:hypothetical protein
MDGSAGYRRKASVMSADAQKPRHWPFTTDAGADAPTSFRAALARKNARAAAKVLNKEQPRFNRLIVGGRAHTKQHGLS